MNPEKAAEEKAWREDLVRRATEAQAKADAKGETYAEEMREIEDEFRKKRLDYIGRVMARGFKYLGAWLKREDIPPEVEKTKKAQIVEKYGIWFAFQESEEMKKRYEENTGDEGDISSV